MAPGSLAALSTRSEGAVLPPLSEAVPELRETYPGSNRQSWYPQTLHSSPRGPPSFPESHGLPVSTPLTSSRSAQGNSTSNHTPHSSRSDTNYSNGSPGSSYSNRRGPYSSTGSAASLSSTTRHSTPLSSAQPYRPSSMGRGLDYREQRGLPPIYTPGYGAEPDPRRLGTLQYDAMSPGGSPLLSQAGYHYGSPQDYSTPYANRNSYPVGGAGGNCAVTFDPNADYGGGNKKRRKGNLPKNVTEILRNWFQDHVAHPYPTEEEKIFLMKETGLTMSQISNWFINARRRSLPQMEKQAQAEEGLRNSQGESMALMKG